MGHISKKLDIQLNLDEHAWRTNLSTIIKHMKVTNVENVEELWEDTSADQDFIDKTLNETVGLLDQVTLSPKAASVSIYGSLMQHLLQGICVFILFYLVCSPGAVMRFRLICCNCGRQRPQTGVVPTEQLNM